MANLRSQVLTWLEATGSPLEMGTAAAFQDAGFEVRQSTTYADPPSVRGREIGLLANDPDIFGLIDLSAVIECNASPNPWVVMTAPHAMEAYNRLRTRAVFTDRARTALTRRRIDELSVEPLLHPEGRCGYALRQAFTAGNETAYQAATRVLSACKALFPPKSAGGGKAVAAALPIIVVNSPLLECEMQPDGTLRLTEVGHSEFLFSARLPEPMSCCIRVTTASSLAATAKWAKEVATQLRKDLQPEEAAILQELRIPSAAPARQGEPALEDLRSSHR